MLSVKNWLEILVLFWPFEITRVKIDLPFFLIFIFYFLQVYVPNNTIRRKKLLLLTAGKLTGHREYDLLIVDYDGGPNQQMDSSAADAEDEAGGWNCSVHPSVFFLLGTLVLTTCATGMLCGAIMTDHWEEVTWDRTKVQSLANDSLNIYWLLDGIVAKVSGIEGNTIAWLVPIHGGIWTLCFSLTGMDFHNCLKI